MPLQHLVYAEKSIPVRVEWVGPDKDEPGYMWFEVALEIDGVTEAGLVLNGGTYQHHPDRNVCFELVVRSHRRIPLIRAEWRSLRGGHSNKRRYGCQGPWAGKRVPATHIHTFESNWLPDKEQMRRGNLPCAEPVAEELQTFEEFRDYVGRVFRIKNIDVVPWPDWRYDLFNESGGDHGG